MLNELGVLFRGPKHKHTHNMMFHTAVRRLRPLHESEVVLTKDTPYLPTIVMCSTIRAHFVRRLKGNRDQTVIKLNNEEHVGRSVIIIVDGLNGSKAGVVISLSTTTYALKHGNFNRIYLVWNDNLMLKSWSSGAWPARPQTVAAYKIRHVICQVFLVIVISNCLLATKWPRWNGRRQPYKSRGSFGVNMTIARPRYLEDHFERCLLLVWD